MTTFEWNDTLKVVIGEVSRKGQLDVFRWIDAERDNYTPSELVTAVDDQLSIAATRAVYVQQGGAWVAVNGQPVTVADELTLSLPLTIEAFRALPVSLTDQWITEAVAANRFLVRMLFGTRTPATETPNAPASDSGQ